MKPGMCIVGTVVFRAIGSEFFPFLYVDRNVNFFLDAPVRRMAEHDGKRVMLELVPGDTGRTWKVRKIMPL